MEDNQFKMYEPAKLSAEKVLQEKMSEISFAWLDGQREKVLEAMSDYARQCVTKAVEDCKGYRTDTEYVSGQSLNEWLAENNI